MAVARCCHLFKTDRKEYHYTKQFNIKINNVVIHVYWTGVAHIFDIPFYQGHALLDLNPEVLDDMEITNLPYNQTDMDYADYWVDLIANYAKYGFDPYSTFYKLTICIKQKAIHRYLFILLTCLV